jgi:hypothetical protein
LINDLRLRFPREFLWTTFFHGRNLKPVNSEEEKFQEYIQILDGLQDRMIHAGLIVRHAHSQKGNG